jgi:hypothetical protein
MYVADWRSATAYLPHRRYDRADFAWEIVRRNDNYWRDFQRVAKKPSPLAAETRLFSQRWGLRFGADPKLDVDQQPIFWLPHVMPTVLQIRLGDPDLASNPLDPRPILDDPATRVERTENDLIVERPNIRHRLRFDLYENGAMALLLPFDRLFEHRIAAALRLWLDFRGFGPGRDPMPLSGFARLQLIRVLRLIDAEHSGASERDIADAVLDASVKSHRDWIGSEGRAQLKRLQRKAHALLEGGYLQLLYPPPRRPRRRRK